MECQSSNRVFTLQLVNDIMELDKLNPLLDSLEDEQIIPMGFSFKIHLALDEMLTNVISYAYPDETGKPILLTITKTDECLSCEICDEGKPFNPLESAPEVDTSLSVEERPIGGLGIFLSCNVADKMEYERKDNQNILRMTFNF